AGLLGPLMDDPGRLASMAAAAKSAGRPEAARLLADLTEAIASGKPVIDFRKEARA
ncbi:MAG: UDP-N-acetylglucosamine--N-acetylmuramyl-(pentapeptide) pyrophosphoryl-undecaprenol N-acetylglucosamine transferase, partial [Mesorhizobium sp.]